ncbi:MAG: FUSC family protein [Silvibacterium sp.]
MASGPIAAYLNDSYIFNWQKQTFASDLIFVAPIAFCLGVGLAVGHPAAGMIAAGGAMTVGFGSKQSIDRSRLLPMIFASVGIAFSTFVGMVAGHANFVLVGIAALWAFGYGMLTARPGGYGWVGQQCVVTLLVGSAFPFAAKLAVGRAALLLAGGLIQVVWSSAALRLFGQLRENLAAMARYLREEEVALRAAIADVAATVRRRRFADSALAYSLRLMVTVGVSTEIYRRLHFASGYWIPMTALLVLKPGLADTASRAIARTLGTVAGAWLLSILVAHLAPSNLTLAVLTVAFAWLSYATLNVNYAMFAVFLTGYIVFLLSLAQIPGAEIAHRRALSTALGGAIALTVRLLVLHRRKTVLRA